MPVPLPAIDELNALDTADLAGALSRVFEANPPLLERLARRRPFRSYADLLAAAREAVAAMGDAERVALLASHPRIGARGGLSDASRREQGAAADAAVEGDLARLQDEYERRHGFRFVVFVAGRTRAAVRDVLRARLPRPRAVELAAGIAEYLAICADRAGVRPRGLAFHPLTEDDLPLVRRWLLAPHVRRWWDDGAVIPYPDAAIEECRGAIRGTEALAVYRIDLDGAPIGLIQHYRIADDPGYAAALGLEEDAVGADLFIGEADLVGRGLGPRALRAFLLDVALPSHGLDVCVIGPSARNAPAIRAYEKIGFRALRDAVVPGERDPERVMRATRAELLAADLPPDPR